MTIVAQGANKYFDSFVAMSFIRDTVEAINVNDAIDAKTNITKLTSEIKKFQSRATAYIDKNYVEFLPTLNKNELFLDEGSKLLREVEDLLETIESDTKYDLYSATEGLRQIVEEFHEVALGLKTSYKIFKIDDLFQKLEKAKSNNEYSVVMNIVGKIKALLDDPSDKVFSRLQCYENIKIKYHIESEMLLHNLEQGFKQLVQFSEKPFQNTKLVTINITKGSNQLQDTVIALFNARYNPKRICDFLIDNVFEPIVTKPVSVEFNESSEDYVQLSLSFSLKNPDENLRPNYKVVFKHIKTTLLCLEYMNMNISESRNIFSIFGEGLKERLTNLVINECLTYSIPDTMEEMKESALVDDITEFHNFLVQSSLLTDNDKELLEYVGKIEILFRNRFCMNIIEKAIEIMRKDLHDMTLVAENTSNEISDSPFSFPRCMVSRSTMELINLMEDVMRQATESEEDISSRLISTVPMIINQYRAEVPHFHEKLLQNIPQQTALFHNNCMFLARWVANNGKALESSSTLVKSLQGLGSDYFLHQIQNQRSQLMDILQGFDLSQSISELGTAQQKIVRQCLRQLELLKNVWQTILPDVVYNKTMTNLLNDVCNDIIRKIITVDDIPSSVANELVEICAVIIERAPTLFQDPSQVLQVKTWMKLTQLKLILSASLVQITQYWCEGKGPLTLNYKAEEVKHLIRALFQNTDRRANALASIV